MGAKTASRFDALDPCGPGQCQQNKRRGLPVETLSTTPRATGHGRQIPLPAPGAEAPRRSRASLSTARATVSARATATADTTVSAGAEGDTCAAPRYGREGGS